jgi:probable phosphoglycerate mutase
VKLIFVRHCEADWPEGWSNADPGLTERGRRQAEATAAELVARFTSRALPTTVWSGPSQRAQETAAIIARALAEAPVELEPDLEGLPEPDLRRGGAEDILDAGLITHLTELQERASGAIDRIREREPEAADAIVVSHDATIGALVCRALAMPLEDLRRFRVDMGSISIIDFGPRRTILAALNDGCHLDAVE